MHRAPDAEPRDSLESAGIPCMLMRGGTSKGAFFLAHDLPQDPITRNELLLRVVGSPDPKQIDGLGGGHPLTSKVAIVSASSETDVDVDYLFLQIGIDTATIGETQTCGNLLAGVGPFAVERGLVPAGTDRTSVRIRLLNTGGVAVATFPTVDGRVVAAGTQEIDGVPGSAAPIILESGGTLTPEPLLPTGRAVDTIEGFRASLIRGEMPVVLLDATEFGLTGAETPEELESNDTLTAQLERVRRAAGPLMGLGDVTEQTIPKLFLLSPPRAGGHIATRAFIPHRVHTSIGVLMATAVAAGVRIPGTIGHALAAVPADDTVILEHPSGSYAALVRVEDHPGVGPVASYTANLRTARKIFDGRVFPRPETSHPSHP